uniref:Uncharacterized protein n=1 Tax=Anguilla anguilla TaxID=7936 RepID=A0A0E9SLM3_ANGAN
MLILHLLEELAKSLSFLGVFKDILLPLCLLFLRLCHYHQLVVYLL